MTPPACCCFAILLPWLGSGLLGAEVKAAVPAPYPTGTYLQRVRRFFTVSDGLPANEIRAVIVSRGGRVIVAAGNRVAQLEGDRWREQPGVSNVNALFAPSQGPDVFAGASNGVWALTDGQWRLDEPSPTEVLAFAAEPSG